MRDRIKVSVIIPVYNSEKYIEKCIESVCNQTLKELEIICIDDGSTDGSAELIRAISLKDDRVRFYTQKIKEFQQQEIMELLFLRGNFFASLIMMIGWTKNLLKNYLSVRKKINWI